MPAQSEEVWRICTYQRPGEVLVAFPELRKLNISAGSNHTIRRIPGFWETIPTMYIPMRNCVSVIAEKKATIRLLLRVIAYTLFKK
jgi:hypothetical protein